MSVYLLVTGSRISDPIRRTGQRGDFNTATVRCHSEGGEYVLASVIAFGEMAEQLANHRHGDAVAVAGRGSLRSRTGKDGAQHHGLSLVADQLASGTVARSDTERRRNARALA